MKKMLQAIILLSFATALFLSFVGKKMYDSDYLYKNWSTTSGIIQSSEVKTIFKNAVSGTANGQKHKYWSFVVADNYTINGISYTGSRFANSSSNRTLQSAETGQAANKELLAMPSLYSKGKQVTVHYDPTNPGERFLELDTNSSKPFFIIAGILFVIGLIATMRWFQI